MGCTPRLLVLVFFLEREGFRGCSFLYCLRAEKLASGLGKSGPWIGGRRVAGARGLSSTRDSAGHGADRMGRVAP